MIESIKEYWPAILVVLLAVSEALPLSPSLRSNSIFQLVMNFLRKSAGKSPQDVADKATEDVSKADEIVPDPKEEV